MRKDNSSVAVCMFLAFSGQALADSLGEPVDLNAESISQYIDMADINRESQSASKAQAKSSKSKPINSVGDHRRVLVERGVGWLNAGNNKGLTVFIPDTSNRAIRLSSANGQKGRREFIVSLEELNII